ncbi:hypothetical protein FD951_14970 [Pseudomonas chlororaphis subsp. aurantiaca]|nr:hypothetical protein FD951_14970 [Pseudomonas chlororaphis subsp. aurantiaca]
MILIHPPHRQASFRCSSGDWRAAPLDAVEDIVWRSKRSRPESMPPDGRRNEGTRAQRGPYAGASVFWLLFAGPAFRRLKKSDPPSGRTPKWPLPQQWICTPSKTCSAQADAIAGKSDRRPLAPTEAVLPQASQLDLSPMYLNRVVTHVSDQP